MARRRSKPVKAPGARGMAILAGLPGNISIAAANSLKKEFEGWEFIATPFPESLNQRYNSNRSIGELLRKATDFSLQTLNDSEGENIPRPSQIVVVFPEAPNFEKLVDYFGFSARYVKTRDPEEPWDHGRHWTFRVEDVLQALRKSITEINSEKFKDLKLRIEKMKSHDPLLLPARNFITKNGAYLENIFSQFALNENTLGEVEESVSKRKFTSDMLPAFYQKMGSRNLTFCYDNRGYVFARTSKGQHGFIREVPAERKEDIDLRRRLLEALFRFGTPLSDGFQHDVQPEGGKQLINATFRCAEAGEIKINGDHANIYSNDVVRG